MELLQQLNKLNHSTACLDTNDKICKKYTWKFYDSSEECLTYPKTLEHRIITYNIRTLNTKTMMKETIQKMDEYFIVFSIHKKNNFIIIHDIHTWLQHNFKFIQMSHDKYIESSKIIQYIQSQIGNHTFSTSYEIGWFIKDTYTLSIQLYKNTITLLHKKTQKHLSEKQLITFIQKNKDTLYTNHVNTNKHHTINTHNHNTPHILIRQERCVKKISQKYPCLFLKKSSQERYEIQTCKPYPIKYPWNNS